MTEASLSMTSEVPVPLKSIESYAFIINFIFYYMNLISISALAKPRRVIHFTFNETENNIHQKQVND